MYVKELVRELRFIVSDKTRVCKEKYGMNAEWCDARCERLVSALEEIVELYELGDELVNEAEVEREVGI